ncbi:MAG: hypothetical protein AAF481_10550 [Acidobacteriota bacterium]
MPRFQRNLIRLATLLLIALLGTPALAGQTYIEEMTADRVTTTTMLGFNIARCKSEMRSECVSWGNSTCRPSAPQSPARLLGDFDYQLIFGGCGNAAHPGPCVYTLRCTESCRVTCANNPTPPPVPSQCDYTNQTVCNGHCPGRFNNNGVCFNWTSVAPNCWMCRCRTGTPACECTGTCGPSGQNPQQEQNGDPECPGTPIVIDMDRGGFHLTSLEDGVLFDINADGIVESVAWTDPSSGDGWLFLDRNQNGRIDDGGELFGDSTPLVAGGPAPHGFAALADLDAPFMGGNGDGILDASDERFQELGVWVDANHNGELDKGEARSLDEAAVLWIELDFVQQKSRDEHGNWFQYKGQIWVQDGLEAVPQVIYDVILQAVR